MVNRFDVYIVFLDPTLGSETKKTRPCLIVSPDEMNGALNTVIAAPMTTTIRRYPSRVQTTFQKKKCEIVLDRLRAIDEKRLMKKLGTIHPSAAVKVLHVLQEMFT